MLFLSYFGIKVIEQTIDDFNDLITPINLFIVISVDYIWYKYISKYGKKEMETFMFIEDFYKILYFMFGLLIASIFSSGDSFFFAILCIILEIIVILALILYFLNNCKCTIEEMIVKLKYLSNNKDIRQEMSINAVKRSHEFDWNIIAAKWERIILDAIKNDI